MVSKSNYGSQHQPMRRVINEGEFSPPEKFDINVEDGGDESDDHNDKHKSPSYISLNKKGKPLAKLWTMDYMILLFRDFFAEFIGTALFLYVCILSGDVGEVFPAAFTAGAMIFVLICSFGGISGALFNPAVSIGFFLVGEIPLVRMLVYILAQTAGSVVGAYTARAVLSESFVFVEGVGNITVFEKLNGGAHFLHGGITPGTAIVAEAIYCFTMMVVVYSAAIDLKTRSTLGALAVGFVVTLCILSGWNNTSGSFNPCRSFGSAVAVSYFRPDVWPHHYVYWVGPIIGCLVATFFYRLLFADESHTIKKQVLRIL